MTSSWAGTLQIVIRPLSVGSGSWSDGPLQIIPQVLGVSYTLYGGGAEVKVLGGPRGNRLSR
jgi:hypothetical protein